MATQVYSNPTASQWASATAHLEHRSEWRVVRIAGTRYVSLPSGTSGKLYFVRADAAACACPWYLKTARQCSHMLSLELAATEDELAEQAASRMAA